MLVQGKLKTHTTRLKLNIDQVREKWFAPPMKLPWLCVMTTPPQ
jgi:hypothetical protein